MTTTTVRRRAAMALGAVTGAIALAAHAAPATAAPALPVRDTLPSGLTFEDCPALPAGADPTWWNCNVAVIAGGKLQIGRIDQPIDKPLRLTYAIGYDPETLEQKMIAVPLKGDPIRVTGGILGVPGTDVLPILQVNAKPELAADPEFNVDANTLLRLKLKVDVRNPLVGDQCTIGTKNDPITLNLTIGTTSPPPPNQPISGSPPVDVSADPLVFRLKLVDNAFAVPRSSSCGPAGLFNGIVDWRAGLPAKAGTNTVVFDQYLASKAYTDLPA
ncbi:hypothetical protein ABZ914_11120 [Spirillospora sp. NPDC046719]